MRENRTVVVKNDLAELEKLNMVLEDFFEENGIALPMRFQVNLALDELITNIISYGYTDAFVHEIIIKLNFNYNTLVITLSDDGVPFNPLDISEPTINKSVEEREIGGLGIHFVRKTMDSLTYRRLDEHKILS